MTTTLSGIAEELERLELDLIARVIGAYHTTRLSDVPANIHIRSKAHVREAFERYAAALIRTADDREKVLREALQAYLDDCSNEECSFCKRARQALGGTNA